MARIAGVDLPRDKRIVIALTYIYGIGNTTAQKVLKNAQISEDIRTRDLTPDQEEKSGPRLIISKWKAIYAVKLA